MIEGHIERTSEQHFRARVVLWEPAREAHGHRVLEQTAPSCRELDDALVFIVAMMLDPNLSLEGLPPALVGLVSSEVPAEQQLLAELDANPPQPVAVPIPTEPAPPAAAARPLIEDPEPTPEVPRTPALPAAPLASTWELGVMGVGMFEVAPSGLLGLGASLARQWGTYASLMGTLRGTSGLGAMSLPEHSEERVKAQAFDAAVALCGGMAAERGVRVRACVGPEYSLWRQRGASFDRDRSALLSGVGVAATLELRVRLRGTLGFVASGSARANLLGRRFVYDDTRVGYAVPELSYLVSLGPSLGF
ncbi:MAG: hypothetical protein QM778_21415 [Myxococcales bacterium]